MATAKVALTPEQKIALLQAELGKARAERDALKSTNAVGVSYDAAKNLITVKTGISKDKSYQPKTWRVILSVSAQIEAELAKLGV